MIIAIDYDGTISADKGLFKVLIGLIKMRGHEVIIATMRHESEPIDLPLGVMVYYTGRKAKGPFLLSMGIRPDIWIDDNPAWIYQDSA